MRLHLIYHLIRQNNVNPLINITSTFDIQYSVFNIQHFHHPNSPAITPPSWLMVCPVT